MRLPVELLRRCWILAGPTASGKSAVALELAERIGAEIVALDSMTLYRGLDVGTAKPTPADQARVPHHLLDVLDPHEEFSLAEYLRAAEQACAGIVARGRTPLLVGGTGLYLRGLLRGVFDGPAADLELRGRLERIAAAAGPAELHRRLAEVDPATAVRLHVNDLRRVIRALEVAEATGRPLSEQQQETPLPPHDRPARVVWLDPPRDWLATRIDARVVQMLDAGWLDEVRRLSALPSSLSRTALQAVGYALLLEHLAGRLTLAAAVDQIQARTRQFAKRQFTWFRHLEEAVPWPITGRETPAELAAALAAEASKIQNPQSKI